MQAGAVVFGQMQIAHGFNVFRQAVIPLADLHILGVRHDGDALLLADGKGACHGLVVLHALAVLGHKAHRGGQRFQMIQRFTVKVLGDAQGLVAAAQAHALGFLHYAVGNGHAGAHGVCVGHQVYKGIAACRSCLAAGGDVLFILKAGRAPMAVGVHKAGQRRKAAAVQRFLAGPGFQLQALRKNFAVPHAKVKLFAICASKILQDHGIFSFLFCPAAPGGLLGFG